MLNSMEQLIRQLELIPPGSTVLCAVSGGADSVCLLHALYRLRSRLGFSLAAAHFDHQLRGEESRRDARFVEQFVSLCCGAQHLSDGRILPPVSLYLGSGDVAGQARARGAGLEETAREMRYAFLRRAAAQAGADRIATAHTADDNAETILLHLTRGAGLRGLGGIPPRRGEIIRPLLTTTRREVEEYLAFYALPHMEDSSNLSDEFSRNRIRHQVIPVLEELSPGFLSRMEETAALLRADEDCLTGLARELAAQARPVEGGFSLDARALSSAPIPVSSRAVRLLLGQLWGGDQNCARVHLTAVLDLCRGSDPSAQIHLPHNTLARRVYDRLELCLRRDESAPLSPAVLPLPGRLTWGGWLAVCRAERYEGGPQGPWEFWLDREAAPSLTLRPRRTGDHLTPAGRPGKSLKKWMIQEKIPRHLRDTLPILDCRGAVAAAAGLGPDRAFLPRPGQAAWHIALASAPDQTIPPKETEKE